MTKPSVVSLLALLPVAISAQVVTPPASAVFDKDAVHEIRLTFKQADWFTQLTSDYDQYPDNTPYREASLVWGQYKFDIVGVRFKGNSSYRGATTKKKPFRIKLNEFTKGQKIDSMASFGLSNAWNDPSFVREKPYYEMAVAIGLPAARSNFAALYINDEYWGLYILGEIVNGDFLKNHFAKGDDTGNLYKASDPGANLAYLGENPTSYQSVFSKESNEDVNDWTDLIELARIFDQTAIADLPAKLDKLIDVDSFLTALALDNATVNLDSYVGMAQNYYLYRRPSDQKWVWIVWDPSLAFGALSQGLSVQQMKDLALEWVQPANTGGPVVGGGIGGGSATRPIASKLWQVPAYKQRYRTIYRSLVEKAMVPATVVARMNALRTLIRPSVEKDTQKLVTLAQFEAAMTSDATSGTPGGPGGGGAPQGGAPALQPFIEGRVTSVKALLDGQTPLLISAAPLSLYFAQTAASSSSASQNLTLALSDAAKSGTF
ncbi:MAG: CotH kinase family protein, partial [Candidatus Solibacter sp.]|nr:CotH kinase family protein [Candidatus Solibacter sp.]